MSELILPEVKEKNYITIAELDGRPNVVLSVIIDPATKEMQVIVNTDDEMRLWATWHRIEDTIRFVLQQAAIKRQATGIQVAPASVLDMLNGK